jgi:hypothetical protein
MLFPSDVPVHVEVSRRIAMGSRNLLQAAMWRAWFRIQKNTANNTCLFESIMCVYSISCGCMLCWTFDCFFLFVAKLVSWSKEVFVLRKKVKKGRCCSNALVGACKREV